MLGFYNGSDLSVIRTHIAAMQYAHIRAGIASWWGQGSRTDTRVATLLATAHGASFCWSLYYELESSGNPSVGQIQSDLSYIASHYASQPNYWRIGDRPVIFVYADSADACGMVDRWVQANSGRFYLVLKVFPGFAACGHQPDNWHQYAPAASEANLVGHSFSISPGFWKWTESTPRLGRDLARWKQNVRDMIASRQPLQLITTFNEWGEGTSVEDALEWQSSSGYGAYLDALHIAGP